MLSFDANLRGESKGFQSVRHYFAQIGQSALGFKVILRVSP